MYSFSRLVTLTYKVPFSARWVFETRTWSFGVRCPNHCATEPAVRPSKEQSVLVCNRPYIFTRHIHYLFSYSFVIHHSIVIHSLTIGVLVNIVSIILYFYNFSKIIYPQKLHYSVKICSNIFVLCHYKWYIDSSETHCCQYKRK